LAKTSTGNVRVADPETASSRATGGPFAGAVVVVVEVVDVVDVVLVVDVVEEVVEEVVGPGVVDGEDVVVEGGSVEVVGSGTVVVEELAGATVTALVDEEPGATVVVVVVVVAAATGTSTGATVGMGPTAPVANAAATTAVPAVAVPAHSATRCNPAMKGT
jgi:hypothetical protein